MSITPEILPKCLEPYRSLINFTNDNFIPDERLFINVKRTFNLAKHFVKEYKKKEQNALEQGISMSDNVLNFNGDSFYVRDGVVYVSKRGEKTDIMYVTNENGEEEEGGAVYSTIEHVATVEDFHPIFERCDPVYFLENFIYDFPTEGLKKVDSSACQVSIKFPSVQVKVTMSKLLEHSILFVELYDDCLRSVKGDEICIDVNIDCSKEVANGVKKLIDSGSSWDLDVQEFVKDVDDAVKFLQVLDFLGIRVGE